MPVTSKDIPASRVVAERRPRLSINVSGLMLGMVGFLFGILLWIFGARYTIDGALSIVNWNLGHLGVPMLLMVPPTWPMYLILAWIPFAFSYVEWKRAPWQPDRDMTLGTFLSQGIVWFAVFALDAGTTYGGLGITQDTTPLIMREIAASAWTRGSLAALVTILPEGLMGAMAIIIKRLIRWQ